ncbi:MAG: patatin-like protein [Flavobacteriaceae bacterium]
MERDKELRLALVLYGGVSLAIYMFGVTREVQKLARASRLYFAEPDANIRHSQSFPAEGFATARETDTEGVYFDLLQALAGDSEIRVVCDVISGASAGGVTGMFLSRALAHDLPLDPLRELWLTHADVLELADEKARYSRWIKMVINPFLRMAMTGRMNLGDDPETRAKLEKFMNLRWFKPPFSGAKFTHWMFDACARMDEHDLGHSLLPHGHPLDLFISLTDFNGHPSHLQLHDPSHIAEREHRFPLTFRYRRSPTGLHDTLGRQSVPGLVFAARATASFPGAFPPATIREIDQALRRRGQAWPDRKLFLNQNFSAQARNDRIVEDIPFIDGSVVNNKPFAFAIAALGNRPAQREIARRIVYVDPNPDFHPDLPFTLTDAMPGFFRAIVASLAEIPRNEPIVDDLAVVEQHNRHVHLVASAIDAAIPQVGPMLDTIIDRERLEGPSSGAFAEWRDKANTAAAAQSGFAFQSYLRLKTLMVLGRVNTLVASLADAAPSEIPVSDIEALLANGDPRAATPARAVRFLRAFDVDFRVRRLRFVISRLNVLYKDAGRHGTSAYLDGKLLDELKNELYAQLDKTRQLWKPETHGDPLRSVAADILAAGPIPDPDEAAKPLAEALDLESVDRRSDELFSIMVLNYLPEWARYPLIVAYVGFPFFDVLTLPMTQQTDLAELDPVLIDRISPADANAIRGGGAATKLKGIALHHFGAFFNRRWRENDYLWGRLTAAERLVDILVDAAGAEAFDTAPYKDRLFEAILDAEAPHLKADPELIPSIRAEWQKRRKAAG